MDHFKKAHEKIASDRKEGKIEKVMSEFKNKELHSGSKSGPKVTDPKQAISIALSESKMLKKKK